MRLFERLFLTVGLLLPIVLCATGFGAEADKAGPWAQWRGPEGLGVSSEPNLPEVWSQSSENIRWKTEIPGEGNSSPVVSNGRVILTTAYESPRTEVSQRYINLTALGLAIAFLACAVVGFLWNRRQRARKKISTADGDLPGRRDMFFRWFTSLVFIALALLVTIGRRHCDSVLGNIGKILAQRVLVDIEHLFSIYQGVPAANWLTFGGIAFLGLAVCVGWLRTKSIWRLLGLCAVIFLASKFVRLTPLNQWKEEISLMEKVTFIFPGLLVASWHLLATLWHILRNFEVTYKQTDDLPETKETASSQKLNKLNNLQIRWKKVNIWRIGGIRSIFFVLLLVGLSLLVFIPPNFYNAQLGFQRVVVCVDMKTGKLLWQRSVFVAPPERKHADNKYATPTAVADGTYIVANFGVGTACLDFEGNILWRQDDPEYIFNTRYGAAGSVVLTDETVIILQEREYDSSRPTWIAAYDKRTGKARWKITPESVHECFTTPLLFQGNNKTQLIIATWGSVISFDADTGKRLWVKPLHTEQLVASPTRSGTLLCIGAGTWGPLATMMMRLNDTDDNAAPEIIWQTDKDTPANCSPVIYDGKLFTVSDSGKISCFDAETGNLHWNKRLKGSRYLSSLAAGDGKVYVSNTKGLTTVIAADSEFKVLAENNLRGRCYASPAFADGCILLRIANQLYCIEKER